MYSVVIILILTSTVVLTTEIRFFSNDREPSFEFDVLTLDDIWYPGYHGDWQPYPIMFKGVSNIYYQTPTLMYPNSTVIEVFFYDATYPVTDFSWMGLADYDILWNGGWANVTLTPAVTGSYGDSEDYVVNEIEWQYWDVTGLQPIGVNIGRGVSLYKMDLTNYREGDFHSIVKFEIYTGIDVFLTEFEWTLLIQLPILLEEASAVQGHQIHVVLDVTTRWTPMPLGLFKISGDFIDHRRITLGDGIDDDGRVDSTFYMLPGDVSILYDLGDF